MTNPKKALLTIIIVMAIMNISSTMFLMSDYPVTAGSGIANQPESNELTNTYGDQSRNLTQQDTGSETGDFMGSIYATARFIMSLGDSIIRGFPKLLNQMGAPNWFTYPLSGLMGLIWILGIGAIVSGRL